MFRVQELAELLDVLVVMPGMPLFGFWTDWWNHGRQGPPRVRTYFLREVVPLVERDYGAGTRRAAAGEPQDGFGALGFTARIPGLFGAVAAFGAPVHPIRHPEMWLSGAKFLGVDGYAVFGDPWEQWEVWLDWDPFHHAEGLRRTPVYLASGDGLPDLSTERGPIRASRAPRNGSCSPTTTWSPPKPSARKRPGCSVPGSSP